MADTERKRRNRKYTAKESEQAMPSVREFNKLAKVFLKLLNQKIDMKTKRLNQIKFMVDEAYPMPKSYSTISIQTIDMKRTIVKKEGSFSYNQTMDWEEELRKQRKGLIL